MARLVKKFPTFFGPHVFVTSFTRSRHLSLSWSRPVQSMSSHPTSWRFVLILSSHLGLGFPRGVYKVASRGKFSDHGPCQLRPGLLRVRLWVAPRVQFSVRTVVYRLRPALLEWIWSQRKLITWYVVEKENVFALRASGCFSKNFFLTT